jgi:predicted Ser/Thr protein kinase
MIYSLDEIKKATNNFSKSNFLGAGAFGEVFRGYVRHTKVAVKVKTGKVSL